MIRELSRLGPLPLVGRERELARLRAVVKAAQGGAAQMMFVSGESGVGKTRLVEAMAADATAAGCCVVMGHAFPAEGGFPFALAADALSQLVRALGPNTVTLLTRGHEHDLAMILPTLARPGAAVERPTGDDAKARVFWQVERFVRKAAELKPIVLVLENVQWADASSLELLHFLVRQLASARVAALCTYNPQEREITPALRAAERSLRRAGRADHLEVEPLTRDDLGELVRQCRPLGARATDAFADLLYTRTLGNPFFVEELLAATIAAGDAAASPEWADSPGALPSSVRDAVLARADALDPTARAVLDCVAAMGLRAPRAALQAATGVGAESLDAALQTLGARGLLREHADDAGAWFECDHPLVRATLYDALGRSRAQSLHARIADAFESLQPAGSALYANEIAVHCSRAGDAAATPRAAHYLAVAGRAALQRHADREAVALLQSAVTRAGADGSSALSAERGALLDDLARARQRLGEYDAAYALWSEARHHARLPGNADLLARIERRMGLSAFWTGRPLDAVAHFDAAISVARAHGMQALVVRTLISRGTALRAGGDLAGARANIEEALGLAATVGDAALLARVHRAALLDYAFTGPASSARAHAAKALEFAEACGDGVVAWSAHWGMAVLAGFTGDGATVARHSAEAEQWAARLGSPVLGAWTNEIGVEYAAGVGEWTTALARADRAIEVARAVDDRTLLPRLLVWKGLILLARDETAAGKACLDESWELSGADAPERAGADLHAIILAHTGRAAHLVEVREYASAIRIGERGLALAERYGFVAWAVHRLLPVLCEAALWARDYDRVARYVARLRQGAVLLDHRLAKAWADGADALLLRLRDQDPRAVDALLAAAADLEQVPFVYHAARLRRNAAQILAADGDRERALAELRLAHEMFRKMGAERELRGTREEIRALGARPPQRATPGAGTLTGREREIAMLLAERRTNREIGEALDISPRTVSTHLANVFQKLGIDSRGALIDLVRADPSLTSDTAD